MGCNGSGKTVWKRANWQSLPDVYIDMDSIADGIGSWNNPKSRDEAMVVAEERIKRAIRECDSYGVESTFSGERGVNQLEEANKNDYRLLGHYFGTASPEINIARIKKRVSQQTGHQVALELIENRWRYSLSNLRKNAEKFDELTIYDNSDELDLRYTDPPRLVMFEMGRAKILTKDLGDHLWFQTWMESWEERKKSLDRMAQKKSRGRIRGMKRDT